MKTLQTFKGFNSEAKIIKVNSDLFHLVLNGVIVDVTMTKKEAIKRFNKLINQLS